MHDYHYIPIMIAGAILFLLFLFFIFFYMLYHKRRIQQQYVEKEKLIYDHNFNLLKARLEEQEGAMSQISREIHDNVSQKIDFLQMNSKALREENDPKFSARIIENISQLAEQIGNDLRNISYTLNSDYVTAQGLVSVLTRELEYISASRSMDCRIQVTGILPSIAPESELLIYRIVQEALHNCIKHADASLIRIMIGYEQEQLRIVVADNGKGFDTGARSYKEGLGFRSMQQRAALLKARLHIAAAPGAACQVTLEITADAMQAVRSGEILNTY